MSIKTSPEGKSHLDFICGEMVEKGLTFNTIAKMIGAMDKPGVTDWDVAHIVWVMEENGTGIALIERLHDAIQAQRHKTFSEIWADPGRTEPGR